PVNPVTSERRKLSVAGDLSATIVVAEPKFLAGWSDCTRASATGVNVPVAARAGVEVTRAPTDWASTAATTARRAKKRVRGKADLRPARRGFVRPVPISSLCVAKTPF